MSYRRSFKPTRKKKGKVCPTTGTRSKYESTILSDLKGRGVRVEYETEQLEYEATVSSAHCPKCGCTKVLKKHKYTPDFIVTRKNGTKLYIEAKGYFKSTDRSKMRAVLKSNPDLDIRMMFMSNGKITEDMRYSDWIRFLEWSDSILWGWLRKILHLSSRSFSLLQPLWSTARRSLRLNGSTSGRISPITCSWMITSVSRTG